jgi:hypothetical protein
MLRSPSSMVLASNIPEPQQERIDPCFPGFVRTSSGTLTRSHRGYIIAIYQTHLGWCWVVQEPIPGSDKGQLGMRFATPSYREAWRSSHYFGSEKEAYDRACLHQDHVIDRIEHQKQQP